MTRLRTLLIALLVATLPLVAGCAERVDSARDDLAEARGSLDKARADLAEARERYERVRSLTIVRTERVDLTLEPAVAAGTLAFSASAERQGGTVPAENLTRSPLVAVALREAPHDGSPAGVAEAFRCDPLTCAIALPAEGAAIFAFADEGAFRWQVLADGSLRAWRDGAWAETDAAGFAFTLAGAEVLATTRVSDATT